MRIYRYSLLILFIIFFKNNNLSSQIPDMVKGGYRECIGYEYKLIKNKVVLESKRKGQYYRYNKNGNLIDQEWYSENGQIYGKYHFKYDTQNRLIEEINYQTDGSIFGRKFIKYKKNGCRIEDTWSHDSIYSGSKKTEIYKNDLLAKVYNFENGKLNSKTFYKYDKKKNLIYIKEYDENGKLNSKTFYKYDKKKNLIYIKEYDVFWDEINRTIYEYKFNSKGQVINKFWDEKFGDYDSGEIKFKYDKNDSLIEYEIYRNGKFFIKELSRFDKKGYLKECVHYQDYGKYAHYKIKSLGKFQYKIYFTYDKYGNLKTKLWYRTPKTPTSKTIYYYN